MKRSPLLLTSLSLALLAGCGGSLFESKKIDYKSAGKLPSLEVPPDLTQPMRDDRYAVPDVSPKGQATYSAYAGERAGQPRATTGPEVLPQVDKMHIERAGTQRWLVVAGSPEKLWPGIKEFWQDLGFIVNVERPEAGIMETDWAEDRAKLPQDIIRSTLGKVFDSLYSTAERDKFRTRVEKGGQPDTTEIYISHRGMYEIYTNEGKSETRWQPRPADPELEAEMLRRLMVRFGMDEVRAKTAVADTGSKVEKAKLAAAKAGGAGTLEVLDAFDRAWRRVGLALDRVGFTVEDRDRSQGLYFVRYVDPEIDGRKKDKDEGFLAKLAFWRSKPDPAKSPRYRILVKGAGESSYVQVLTADGVPETSETGGKILRLLLDQLK
jgi:outer membrane protein assembly factor BamC